MQFIIKLLLVILIYSAGEFSAYAEESVQPDNIYFLGLADIHFDPFVNCDSSGGRCPLIAKLKTAPVNEWPNLLAAAHINSSHIGQDTNYTLLRSALIKASKKAQEENAQFVVVLGDMLGHEYRNDYRAYSGDRSYAGYVTFTNKTMAFLTNELGAAFPDKSVYMVVGNNDSYSGDYVSRPREQFFQDTASMWSRLIKNPANKANMQKTFSIAGYYTVQLNPQLRLLVLNTVIFSHKAVGRGSEQAAVSELAWLHQQLESAKANNERVLIAMHIPTNIEVYAMSRIYLFKILGLWKSSFREAFQADLKEFAPQIVGVLSGHIHFGWFHINQDHIPLSGVPAISPIFGQASKFKLYDLPPVGSLKEAGTFSAD
ncbi:MAG: metallophosphoesterase [Gammaproteobacteria bacterium]